MDWLMKTLKKFIWLAIFGYAVLLAVLFFGQRMAIYHPDQTVPDPAQSGVPEMTARRVETVDGLKPLAWWGAPADDTRPVIILFHGNAGNIGGRAKRARLYLDAGFGVLLAGYRYNAGAGGDPSEDALISDGRAAFAFVLSQGVAPERIVLYGESLGSGVAVAIASENAVGALVLEAPFSSLADVAQYHYWYVPARWLVRDEFDSLTRIERIRSPLLLIHGEADTLVPSIFARKLFVAASEPKEGHFLPKGTHGNLYQLGAGDLVVDFLNRRFAAKPDTSGTEAAGGQ